MLTFKEWLTENYSEVLDEGFFDNTAKWGRGLAASAALMGGIVGNNASDGGQRASNTPNFSQGDMNYHWNSEIGRYSISHDNKGQIVYHSRKGKFIRIPDRMNSTGFRFVKVS